MKKIIKYLTHPREALICLMNKNFFFFLPDKLYLKWKYKLLIGKKLDLKNPKLLSEKLQWLKLYNRNPEYTEMVDKYEVRNYIENKIGKQYLIPLVGVYDNFNDIDFDKLPNQFVIKCTHDSGGLVICKDKNTLNMKAAKKKINKFIENKDKSDLLKYNIFCFNGIPKLVSVCYGDKEKNRFNDFYDSDFNKLDLKCIYNASNVIFDKPKQFDKMKEIASILSKNIPHLRVDFYLCNNKIYLGELTFFHFAGFTKFEPKDYEITLGNYLKLGEGNTNEK